MNWWGRRIGLGLLFLFVLFSCEEDISTIGIKNPDSKFSVRYAEVDIPSTVIRFDKMPTYNSGISADGVQRFLVGQYTDDEFGVVRCEIFTQISPSIDNSAVTANAVLDSMVLQLRTDFYQYGSASASDLTIQIHELTDTIKQVIPYNSSKTPYYPKVIGEKVITIDPIVFDQNVTNNSDALTTNDVIKNYRIPLDRNFGEYILETFRSDSEITNDFTKFTGKHKGLAIIPTISDKILGINPTIDPNSLGDGTKLTLYYTEDAVHKQMNFTLYPFTNNPVIGYSSIESNTTGTALQSLTNPYVDFIPSNNKRYIQSGIGILTKLDFSKFFQYMDTVSNAVLNSVELVIENESSDLKAPTKFQFKALGDDNKYKSALLDTVLNDIPSQFYDPGLTGPYQRSLAFNGNGSLDIKSDAGETGPLYVTAGTSNTISAFVTEFFQSQYKQIKSEKKIKYVAFHPIESEFRKSVNRFILKDNMKLKFYYTVPVVETIE